MVSDIGPILKLYNTVSKLMRSNDCTIHALLRSSHYGI